MYKLTKIEDAHSSKKSPLAKMLVQELLPEGCEYVDSSSKIGDFGGEEDFLCQNNIEQTLTRGKSVCSIKIMDKFYLCPELVLDTIIVGNTCISKIVLAGLVSNVNAELLDKLVKALKVTTVCFLCNKSHKNGYHKTCIQGKNTNTFVNHNQIQRHNKCMIELVCAYHRPIIGSMFSGVRGLNSLLRKPSSELNIEDLSVLKKTLEKYSFLFTQDLEEWLRKKDNYHCLEWKICNTIKNQTRYPSDKQMAIIYRLVTCLSRANSGRGDKLRYVYCPQIVAWSA